MQLIIFGAPGVGKGTVSGMLAHKYKIPHISTGDIFRSEIGSGNSEFKQYVEKGLLVPDMVVNKIIEKALKSEAYRNGFILDGYPRTTEQAEFLENALWKLRKKIDLVLNLAASEEVIIKRLTARRNCGKCGAVYNLVTIKPKKKDMCDKCGSALVQRKDDEPGTVRKRIQVYQDETAPLIEYYKKKKILADIDASPRPRQVFNSAVEAVEKEIPQQQ